MKTNDVITSDDILGKDALDSDGEILGVVTKLHIHKVEKKIKGITIDQGFMKPDLYLGLEYIRHFGKDAVLLNRIPPTKFKGMKVLSADGEYVGIVKQVSYRKSKLDNLLVALNRKDDLIVLAKQIKEIGGSIILKKEADEVEEN